MFVGWSATVGYSFEEVTLRTGNRAGCSGRPAPYSTPGRVGGVRVRRGVPGAQRMSLRVRAKNMPRVLLFTWISVFWVTGPL